MTMSTVPSASPSSVAACVAGGHEPRQQPDLDRKGREPLRERGVVLRGEDGRRDEDRDLLAVLDRLERGAQRDLGLAVADVADDQPVHRASQLHVGLDLGRGTQLVDGLLVRERRLHLGLPWRVATEGVSLGVGARGVQREELLGEVVDRLADALLGTQPFRAAQLGQCRALATRVAGDPADLLDRHEDPVAAGERQLEVVAILAGAAAPQHLLVASDAMVDVDDEVARRESLEDVARDDPTERLRPPDADGPEQLAVGDEGEAVRAADEAAVEAAFDEGDGARRRCLPHPPDDRHGVAGLAEDVGQARRLVRGEDDAVVVGTPGLDGLDKSTGTTGWQDGLAPAERIARRERATGHRRVLGRDRLPGELEGTRRHESVLPVARRQVRRRPVLRQLTGLDQLGAPFVGLAPEEAGGLGDVARLVEHEQGARTDVVEAGRRSEVGGPDLGGVTDGHRSARLATRDDLQRVGVEAGEVRGETFRESRGGPAESVPDRGRPTRREEELGGGQQDRALDRGRRPLVGRVERAQRVDLVAEELDPDRERHRRREDVDDAAASRRLTAACDFADRHVPEVEQLAQQCVLVES